MAAYNIRSAVAEDVPGIRRLIMLLAEYENELHSVKITEEELLRDGFGVEKYFNCLVAQVTPSTQDSSFERVSEAANSPVKGSELVGYAFYFYTYSTWEGRTLYIEDIFVQQEYRGRGIGTQLLRECAKIAVSKQCLRMNWQVLDWNTSACEFYQKTGAKMLKEWMNMRMDRYALKAFAEGGTENAEEPN